MSSDIHDHSEVLHDLDLTADATAAEQTTAATIAHATAPRRRGTFASTIIKVIPPMITFGLFLGVWYLYSSLKYDVAAQRINALPYPHEIVREGFMPWWDPENRAGFRPILGYMWPTLKVTLIGLGISIVLGTLIAVIMNFSKHLERAVFPYAVIMQTVPILAITPLLTQLFGDRLGVRLVVVILIAMFPIITNTLFGLQSTDRLHHDLFTLNGASRWTRLRKLELPTALPAMLTGIRIASGLAVIGAIVADFFFSQGDKGIGYFIRNRQQRAANRPDMFAGTIMASFFGVVMFLIVGLITRRAIKNWHDSAGENS
jgi:NitT/TauT family transport system permease protein